MPTNVILPASAVCEPEDMTPDMKLVILKNGDVVFVNTREEYQRYVEGGFL